MSRTAAPTHRDAAPRMAYLIAARLPRMGVALALALSMAGCDALKPFPTAKEVRLLQTNATVAVNQTVQVGATAYDKNGKSIIGKKISFITADPTIAGVSSTGIVSGVKVGSTTLTAQSDGAKASMTIDVIAEVCSNIQANPATLLLRVGNTRTVSATCLNNNGQVVGGHSAEWQSTNNAVATVTSPGGVVTAVAPGQVTIIATIAGRTSGIALTVTPTPVKSIVLSPTTADILVGQPVQVNALVKDTADNLVQFSPGTQPAGRSFIFSSDNTTIASVNPTTGVVTGVGAGTATISLTSTIENVSGTMKVNVTRVPVKIVLIGQPLPIVRVGLQRQLTAAAFDSAGGQLGNRVFTWSTSNSAVVDVTQAGIITGKALGSATITVTVDGVSQSTVATVRAVPVRTIDVTPLQVAILTGETQQFTASAKDSLGAAVSTPLQWISGNTQIATVNIGTGLATGNAPGTVTISAVASSDLNGANQQVIGTANLVVNAQPAKTVTAVPNPATVKLGNTATLQIDVRDAAGNPLFGRLLVANPADPTIVAATTSSSTNQVQIRGLALGTTNLTIQVLNSVTGNVEASTVVAITVN